jgi:hypothetical protein
LTLIRYDNYDLHRRDLIIFFSSAFPIPAFARRSLGRRSVRATHPVSLTAASLRLRLPPLPRGDFVNGDIENRKQKIENREQKIENRK